jgi:hypothetical protein
MLPEAKTTETRIFYNGRQYAGVEAMPPDARRAYEQLLEQFADTDHNGIPDILERGAAGNVIAVQRSSFTVNGRTFGNLGEMPEALRRLCEEAMDLAGAGGPPVDPRTPSRAHRPDLGTTLTVSSGLEHVLDAILRVLLGLVAVAVVTGAGFLMAAMGAGSRSQGGRLYVVIGALVGLGAVDGVLARLYRRRLSASSPESEEYRRYRVRSFFLLVLAALVLAGLALLLP